MQAARLQPRVAGGPETEVAADGVESAIAAIAYTEVAARRRFERFVALVHRALDDADVADRLGQAGVAVRIDVREAPHSSVTLLLDRTPASVVIGARPERPDVRLLLGLSDVEAMFREGDYLPMRILAGEVVFDGCVRKFLRVLPVLRGAVADLGATA